MTNILAEILAQKELEIAALDPAALRLAAESAPPPRDFLAPLRRRGEGLPVALIAELKRASPSRGILVEHLDLLHLAGLYTENGASAISVVTDEKYFLGSPDTLRELRFARHSPLPLLRKDFIISEAQIYEARVLGADAVLLIVAALRDPGQLAALHACALGLGLTPLVEVHDEAETARVLLLDEVRLIGINNRDLATFQVSLATTERLRPLIPAGITVVAESGISGAEDVMRLAEAGVDAVLVGEALVTAPDVPAKVRELSGATAPAARPKPATF